MRISGWNDFYEGWLTAILLQPCPETAHPFFQDGYRMAKETGLDFAIQVLQAEIEKKHIIVEQDAPPTS